MKKTVCLAAGLFAGLLFLLPACKTTEESAVEDKELDRILTPEEVAKMSPAELEKYKERLRQKKMKSKEKENKERVEKASAVDTWIERKKEQRAKVRDVSRPMTEEDRGSAFPWNSTQQRRSEALHDSMDLGNR